MKATVVIALLLAGCCETTAIVLTHVNNALIACDVGQTYYASDDGRWDRPGAYPGSVQHEMDPILGPTPPVTRILGFGSFSMIANTSIGYSNLPLWLRITALASIGVVEAYIVGSHLDSAGMCGLR